MPKQRTGKIWNKIMKAEQEIQYWSSAKRSRLKKLSEELQAEGKHSSHARYLAYKRVKKEDEEEA